MGPKLTFSLLIALVLSACGNFVGFDSPEPADTGDLKSFKLYLNQDELQQLQNSISSGNFAYLKFEDNRESNAFDETHGKIRIRGNSSRFREKKSFTLELSEEGEEKRYALDAGGDAWFEYGLTLFMAQTIGIHAPQFSAVALFINDKYEGYYNIVELYSEDLNGVEQYNSPGGQLFKPDFELVPGNGDTHAMSEKKFPDDNNFGIYDRLLVNSENMGTSEWSDWIETEGVADMDGIADYMVIRDFFGIRDTVRVNHYVYFNSRGFTFLPWDDDAGFTYGSIAGDSPITKRMVESTQFKEIYREKMKSYFLDSEIVLDQARTYVENNYVLLKQAAEAEPYFSYESFETEYDHLMTFFNERPQDIIDHNPDWNF